MADFYGVTVVVPLVRSPLDRLGAGARCSRSASTAPHAAGASGPTGWTQGPLGWALVGSPPGRRVPYSPAINPRTDGHVRRRGDDDSVFAALRAGARGYLLKESEGADIARAVRAAARSEAVFGPRIADRVLAFFASSRARSAAVPFPELTDREREVLDLVAHLANAAIAARLFLSEKTVRNRVSDVLTKLHAASRAEAVALARDAGLGPEPGG